MKMVNNSPQQTYNQYKIRQTNPNPYGGLFGITIPRIVAKKYEEVKWTMKLIDSDKPVEVSGTCIIFYSGLDLTLLKKEIENYDIEQYQN